MDPFSLLRAARGEYEEFKSIGQCEVHGDFDRKGYAKNGETLGYFPKNCLQCAASASEEQRKIDEAQKHQNTLEKFGVPKRFLGCTFDNYHCDPVNAVQFEIVKDYANRYPEQNKTGESLLMLGSVGTGKTHLAIAILKAAIRFGNSARYITAMALVREVRFSWSNRTDRTEDQIIEHYGRCPLLVLDEVGMQNGTDNERVILFEVLNERYENMLPTIVCGNVTIAELSKCLDERIVDRLRENSGKAALFRGKSHRVAA